MFVMDVVFAFVMALLFMVILVPVLGWRRPGREGEAAEPVFLMLLLFLAIWAGGVWMTPFGPMLWNVAWMPYLLVGLFMMLVVAAVVPPPRRLPPDRVEPPAGGEGSAATVAAAAAFGVFFWLLLILLVAAIAAAYVM